MHSLSIPEGKTVSVQLTFESDSSGSMQGSQSSAIVNSPACDDGDDESEDEDECDQISTHVEESCKTWPTLTEQR